MHRALFITELEFKNTYIYTYIYMHVFHICYSSHTYILCKYARYTEGPGFKSWRVSYFLFVPLRSFFLCYPSETLECPISTGVSKRHSTTLILITAYKCPKEYYAKKIESTVGIHLKNTIYIYNIYIINVYVYNALLFEKNILCLCLSPAHMS